MNIVAKPASPAVDVPESVETVIAEFLSYSRQCVAFCEEDSESFFALEIDVLRHAFHLGCLLLKIYLVAAHRRFDYSKWLDSGLYYLKKQPIGRTIKTFFGEVRYHRCYLVRKDSSGGFYPLDTVLGLTRDGFSPFVIKLTAKLATRVSFATSVILFRCFCRWSPSTESIECLVLGLGREASGYMELADPLEGDGEVLVIECDGKATPTATKEELTKRRKKRKKKNAGCNCQRHRGRAKRKCCKRNRRKKGDKTKNGRSITIVVMYTLRKGNDGLLHGPINKKIWASYAPRKVMLAWARRQATKRGFPPGADKRIHIGVDGEKCLKDGLSKLFPEATFTLDIRHVEEKIWKIGRTFYAEGSKELEKWVEEKIALLYEGCASNLVSQLKEKVITLSNRAKRDKKKREVLSEAINYFEPRLDMMRYKMYIDEDLPIATGVVEGAARYVVGERMDCSGMRWIPGRAEALLHLRCIELNGEWDQFYEWAYGRWKDRLKQGEKVMIRTDEPIDLLTWQDADIQHVASYGS